MKPRILITGGTGSFGKIFINYLLKNNLCQSIAIYSRDEMKQFLLNEELGYNPKLNFIIGDVRDQKRLEFAMENIDIVIHAAAMKIVMSAEENPSEAIKTNILGAINVIEASKKNKIKKVIALSTDKACNPVNLYGATKLCSDKLFIAANANKAKSSKTAFSVVRYGNVIGSRGSVVPFFKEKKKDGALPITDIRMTRFWITLEEAVEFVIKNLDRMIGGEIFIPKIPSMKIIDLANVIGPDCKIKIIGIRPGEKLHETMISSDDSRNTIQLQDCYIITPEFDWWDKNKYVNSKPVPKDFEYNSYSNDIFLTDKEMEKIVNNY